MQLSLFSISHSQRTVLLADSASLTEFAEYLRVPSQFFVLLLAADTTTLDGPALVEVAADLIRRGACYVCCWGPDCARLHDCFDEADLLINGEATDDRVLMTTRHEGEPLEEAIWFAIDAAFPTAAYESGTATTVIACVANPSWHAKASAYLSAGAPLLDEA